MSSSVHNLTQRYAVISVRGEPRPERTVVAYLDEKTLRDLLAEPSIVSLGYHSRKEAIASVDGCALTGHGLPANLAAASVDMADRSLDESDTTQPLNHRFGAGSTWQSTVICLQPFEEQFHHSYWHLVFEKFVVHGD